MMQEILLQGLALGLGFIGGVLYAREVYRPLVEWMKDHAGIGSV